MQRFACRSLNSKISHGEKGQQILAIAFREIVAAEACYNRTCYKGCTRAKTSPTVASDGCGKSLEDEYANLESEAYQMLSTKKHIRRNLQSQLAMSSTLKIC